MNDSFLNDTVVHVDDDIVQTPRKQLFPSLFTPSPISSTPDEAPFDYFTRSVSMNNSHSAVMNPVFPMNLKKFSGYPSEDPEKFLSDFVALMRMNNVDTGDIVDSPRMIAAFSLHLTGPEYTWFQTLTEIHRKSWRALCDAFVSHYIQPNPSNNAVLYSEMQAYNDLKLYDDMMLEDYYGLILKKGQRLNKSALDLMTKFIDGLPDQLKFFVREGRPNTIDEAMQSAKMGDSCGYRQVGAMQSKLSCSVARMQATDPNHAHTKRLEDLEAKMTSIVDTLSKLTTNTSSTVTGAHEQNSLHDRRTGRQPADQRSCYKCGGLGHMKVKCKWSGEGQKAPNTMCQMCGQYGHSARNCIDLQKENQ